uniref:XK-related protein n=1 Tax=Culicoides sonorensis TaxID=179676 RepID=A0A336KG55_CULSO
MQNDDHIDKTNTIYPSLVYSINTHSTISYIEILGYLISAIVKFISLVIGVFLAIDYYKNEEYNYFVLTLLCIIIPGLLTVYLIIHNYFEDVQYKSREPKSWFDFIFSLVVLPLCFRYIQSFVYSILCKKAEIRCKTEKQKYYYNLLTKEDADIVLIRLFECFLEATPQKILQITIFLMKRQDLRGIKY